MGLLSLPELCLRKDRGVAMQDKELLSSLLEIAAGLDEIAKEIDGLSTKLRWIIPELPVSVDAWNEVCIKGWQSNVATK